MKKGVAIALLILILFVGLPLMLSEETSTEESTSEGESKIDLAYSCLENKINTKKCSELTLDEKIFSAMTIGKCTTEFFDSSTEKKCWPKSNCNVEDSAKAMLALKRLGETREGVKQWILTKNKSATGLDWFLQVDGKGKMDCKVKYSGTEYRFEIYENKMLSGGAGTCLSLSQDGYSFLVSPSCYGREFEISCDKEFQTSLIYKRTNSPVMFIPAKTTDGSPSGANTEIVNAECFTKNGECDYLSTLWATYALVLAGDSYDVSRFWPYLQAMSEENDKIISEGILHYISKSAIFKADLIRRQRLEGFWSVTGNNFYDTGFALMPFSGESFEGKDKAMGWLLSPGVQDKEGCWGGNILNTALILYSIWPKEIASTPAASAPSCESSGNFCLTPIDCSAAGGTILASYTCTAPSKDCCSKDLAKKTCTQLVGNVCNSNQECVGGTLEDASGLGAGEKCCVGGSCREPPQESACELAKGVCTSSSIGCGSGEKISNKECPDQKVCCIEDDDDSNEPRGNMWIWIIILIILIAIVAILILFKDKLKLSGKKPGPGRLGGGTASAAFRGPGMPPSPSSSIPQRGLPVRRFPPSQGGRPAGMGGISPGQQRMGAPSNPMQQTNEAVNRLKEMNR